MLTDYAMPSGDWRGFVAEEARRSQREPPWSRSIKLSLEVLAISLGVAQLVHLFWGMVWIANQSYRHVNQDFSCTIDWQGSTSSANESNDLWTNALACDWLEKVMRFGLMSKSWWFSAEVLVDVNLIITNGLTATNIKLKKPWNQVAQQEFQPLYDLMCKWMRSYP